MDNTAEPEAFLTERGVLIVPRWMPFALVDEQGRARNARGKRFLKRHPRGFKVAWHGQYLEAFMANPHFMARAKNKYAEARR